MTERALPYFSPSSLGEGLPIRQFYLVEPDGVIGSAAVQVHLESHVDLANSRGARRVRAIEIVLGAVNGHGKKTGLTGGGTIELQHKMVPGVRLGPGASHAGRSPNVIVWIV